MTNDESVTGFIRLLSVCQFVVRIWPKNYRPPRPMGVKGGCSPQNNRKKLSTLVNELPADRNKIYLKNSRVQLHNRIRSQIADVSKAPDFSDFRNVSRRTNILWGGACGSACRSF
jgi:hypothetical protein